MPELYERFANLPSRLQRARLIHQLDQYIEEARSTSVVHAVVVDGSFITTKESPNDIDLVAVLSGDHDFSQELRPFQTAALSHRSVNRRYGFDLFAARDNSTEYREYVDFFQQVRGEPGLRKGIVRIEL